jgi:hypothetical protein
VNNGKHFEVLLINSIIPLIKFVSDRTSCFRAKSELFGLSDNDKSGDRDEEDNSSRQVISDSLWNKQLDTKRSGETSDPMQDIRITLAIDLVISRFFESINEK